MAALLVLLAAAAGLIATGAIGRVAPASPAILRPLFCLVGLVAALLSPSVATVEFGLVFGVDALSGLMLAALFLIAACNAAAPVGAGSLALVLLAGDAIGIVLFLAAAILVTPGGTARWRGAGLACLAVALLLLAWHAALPDFRLAAIRALPPGVVAVVLTPVGALAALLLLPIALPAFLGTLVGLYLTARLLLDLPGPLTPGWWGVPVLAVGLMLALAMARRAAAGGDVRGIAETAWRSVCGLAVALLGVALLGRGADLPPLSALAVGASMLLVVSASVWGGLLCLGVGAIQRATGTTAVARLGGLLNRMPATGLGLLVASASLASLPLTAGFAGTWWALQALLGVARVGGTALLALTAGALAVSGVVLALLALAALRVCGLVLLGPPRSAKAADAIEGSRLHGAAVASMALVTLAVGVAPILGTMLTQPVARLLTGAAAEGASGWSLATGAEAPGYPAPGLALLLGLCIAAAAWVGRTPRSAVMAWRGGLLDDGPADPSPLAVVLWPHWRTLRPALGTGQLLMVLGLLLACALGWSAR